MEECAVREIYEEIEEKQDRARERERKAKAKSAIAFQHATLERMRNWRLSTHLIQVAEGLDVSWWAKQTDLDRAIRAVAKIAEEKKLRGARIDRKEVLTPRTEELYQRAWRQVQKEVQVSDAFAVVEHLKRVAKEKSRSSYRLVRATILRYSGAYVVRQVKEMPAYGDLCKAVGSVPTRKITEITRSRRRTRPQSVVERIMAHLRPETRDAIQALRLLGCRAGELQSAVVEGASVTLATLKHEVRDTRTLVFDQGSPEGHFLLEHQGTPWKGMGADRLRKAWSRARAKEGLEQSPQYCLHAFRHECASRWKKESRAHMRELYGDNWLADCKDNSEEKARLDEYRAPVASRLGHNCMRSTALYGHTRGGEATM